MNFKRFHESENLFDESTLQNGYYGGGDDDYASYRPDDKYRAFAMNLVAGTYTLRIYCDVSIKLLRVSNSIDGRVTVATDDQPYTFTLAGDATIYVSFRNQTTTNNFPNLKVMLNSGSQPLPYEPYSSEVWHDIPYYQHKTATDTLTLPATLYPNDTSITVGLKGNEAHTGTPSPQNPVVISGTGDLETTGEHAGQYKIPILSGGTTPVYLGEVETTRKVKKIIFTGTEIDIKKNDPSNTSYIYYFSRFIGANACFCSHLPFVNVTSSSIIGISANQERNVIYFNFGADVMNAQPSGNTVDGLKEYLAAQYAAGTPVCVWYALATPETAVVNEPLMKIGTYADSLTTTIPCTAGENTLDMQTTVQPSEVTAEFSGWHPVQSVHEYNSNYTIATMQALTIAQLQTHTISDLQGGEWS
jgi:hypothetical protein